MQIQTTVDITSQRIADLMVGAVEGNYMTRAWCAGIFLLSSSDGLESPWYSDPALYDRPEFLIDIVEIVDESQPPEGDNLKHHYCGPAEFLAGLTLMAHEHPTYFGDIVSENDDAETADALVQLIALKDIVYG